MRFRNPLEIPEIAGSVALYLEGGDFARCVQVSRRWRDLFLSHRWRTVRTGIAPENIQTELLGPGPDVIHTHRHLIQDLTLIGRVTVPGKHDYPNVHHLRVDMGDPDSSESISMDLAKTFPSLVKLDLDFVQIESAFWEALSTHHHIRSMRLWCIQVGTDDTPRLWDVCKKLESLELSRVTIEGGGVSKDVVFDRLRELIIWELSELDERNQMDLIIQCPMLECLEWDFDGWMTLSGSRLINQPLQNHWPYLNKLYINCNVLDMDMALILQSVGTGHGNIVDLQVGSCQLETQASKALRLHFNTLVRVDFARFHHASSTIILDILCCCPRLEVLRAKNVSAKDIAEHGPWVCQHLRELEICFHVGDSDQDLQPLIFKRLSTLVRLKHLKMNSFLRSVITDGVLEFRLESGMGQLSTLQQLASLAFGVHSRNMRYFPQLGMDEATWIMNNWKNLKLIKGRLNKDQEIDIHLKSAFKSHGINTS